MHTLLECTSLICIYIYIYIIRLIAKDTIHGEMEDGTMVRLDVLEFNRYIEYSHLNKIQT